MEGITISNLQTNKWRLGKVKELAQGNQPTPWHACFAWSPVSPLEQCSKGRQYQEDRVMGAKKVIQKMEMGKETEGKFQRQCK